MESIELKKMENYVLDGLKVGDKESYALALYPKHEDSGFVYENGWYEAKEYTILYRDANETIDQYLKLGIDKNLPSANVIKVFVREGLYDGKLVIYKDNQVLNYSGNNNPFILVISIKFLQKEEDEEELYSMLLSYDSNNNNSVALSISCKPKMIEAVNKVLDLIG